MYTEGTNGDSLLSANDHKLWSLVYRCLFDYMTVVIFKHKSADIVKDCPARIEFFVQQETPNTGECYKFLIKELEKFRLDRQPPNKAFVLGYPGTIVTVNMFSGVNSYLMDTELNHLTAEYIDMFKKANVKKRKDPTLKVKEE
jgi:hypothetical protein